MGAAEAAAIESLQEVAAWVLGTAVQNAAEMQDHLVELGSVQLLLSILSKSSSADLHAKCLFALSSLLRANAAAFAAFGSSGGYGTLAQLLSTDPPPKREYGERCSSSSLTSSPTSA